MKSIFARSLVAVAACAAVAPAFAGDFMVRARALQLDPANEATGTVEAIGTTVSSKTIWEIDASYFFTPNFAVEVIATTPQKHSVNSTGLGPLGTLRHLPPTVTAQYHFAPDNASVRPYVGLGLNYTHFSAVNLGGGDLTVTKHSWGLAYQIGADFPITKNISLNVDFKKIDIATDVKVVATGAKLGKVKVDPTLFGIGIGYRF
ncbi:MAG: OmpW/AlkL family protein [Aquabacterium sp.]|uniref:OmpW/AlkL family protein n=1 Tax=Aquabacterium sp. TaxID=1872578 RepID=UPI003BDB9D0E